MKKVEIHNIVIIGAGPAGLFLSAYLHKHAVQHLVIERTSKIKNLGFGVLVQDNLFRCFRKIGIPKSTLDVATVKKLRAFHGRTNKELIAVKLHKVPYYAMRRGEVMRALREVVLKQNIVSGKDLIAVNRERGIFNLRFADGTSIQTKHIIGADGIKSVVRTFLFDKNATYSVYSALYFWMRKNKKNTIEVLNGPKLNALTIPVNANESVISIVTNRPIDPQNKNNKSLCEELLLTERLAGNNVLKNINFRKNSLLTIVRRTKPIVFAKAGAALIGDAAHGETPILGWGTTMAIEDSYVLGEELVKYGKDNVSKAMREYYKLRKDRVKILHTITTIEERYLGVVDDGNDWWRNYLLRVIKPFDTVLYNLVRTLYRKLYSYKIE